jgi:hypothetical protein
VSWSNYIRAAVLYFQRRIQLTSATNEWFSLRH